MKELNDVCQKFCNVLSQNGWEIVTNEAGVSDLCAELTAYKKRLTGYYGYGVECYAFVSKDRQGMKFDGHLGVQWIDAIHENSLPYSYNVLTEMQKAIECAEKDLLTSGVPFTCDYNFHGNDAEEGKKQNDLIRSEWTLDETERCICSGT